MTFPRREGQYIVEGARNEFQRRYDMLWKQKPFIQNVVCDEDCRRMMLNMGKGTDIMAPDKIEAFVETHMESVFQFCCFLTGNRSDAEDLSQDTFVKAMELRHKFHGDGEERTDRNYLIGIAVNLWRNQRRKRNRRQGIAPTQPLSEVLNQAESGFNMEEQVLEQELLRMVQEIIASLPDKQKVVIHMFYSAQMSMEEIAKVLHVPKETVKSRLRLAKEKIRKGLEVYGYEI